LIERDDLALNHRQQDRIQDKHCRAFSLCLGLHIFRYWYLRLAASQSCAPATDTSFDQMDGLEDYGPLHRDFVMISDDTNPNGLDNHIGKDVLYGEITCSKLGSLLLKIYTTNYMLTNLVQGNLN
jgi:hypothetical protein